MTLASELPTPVSLPEVAPASDVLNQERYDFGSGEIIRVTPATVRSNEATGEPVAPLLYVQGMNGNDKLPDIMAYLAEHDQRPVIAVRYFGKAAGSPKPVAPGMRGYRADAEIPELDVRRTDDLLAALGALDETQRVSIVAESAGAVRALLTANALLDSGRTEKPAVSVESVLLIDPAGQDGRTYRQTHFDALRLARHEKRSLRLGALAAEAIAEPPTIGAVAKQRRDRPEQRAVAYAQTEAVLADVAQHVPLRVLSDRSDVGFRTERIAAQMQASGAARYAELVQTDKGGHGVGLNKAALDMVITNLHELERSKTL